MLQRKRLTKEQAWQKIKHYCSYQERCHAEAKEKLYSFGLIKQDTEELLCRLIEENHLNEERFAISFAGGRFRLKKWGRVKIKYALKQKRVSEYCIKKALQQINDEQYEQALKKLAIQKWRATKGEGINWFAKMSKTTDFLLQKGYEPELIRKELESFQKD